MKRFKLIDTWISLVLIGVFLLLTLARRDYVFMIGYFVVGGWQVVSMLVHALNGWFCEEGGKRYVYHWVVVITIIMALLGLAIFPLLYLILVVLLFAAPFMAFYYTWICYEEVYVKMQRPLAMLK
jgi:hypothetical protein